MRPIPAEPHIYYTLGRNRSCDGYEWHRTTSSDPYDDERVRSEDHMLHKTLTEIFREQSFTSDQVKELVTFDHSHDQDSIVKLILERKPCLSGIFPKGNKLPLLWIAAGCCYQKTAELLVRSGADVNKPWEETAQMTILYLMLTRMYPSSWTDRFIAQLLEHGADFELQDFVGRTALHLAVKHGRVQATKLLLKKGADCNNSSLNQFDGRIRTPLLRAARSGEADQLVPLLIEHGADVTFRDEEGRNLLYHLAEAPFEQVEAARVLIERGASLNDRQHCSRIEQPLHLAALYEKNELVKLFLDHGADVNALTAYNCSPLHYAVADNDDPAVLKTLLERGAYVDLKACDGCTALHSACKSDFDTQECIKMLLSFGADVCAEDHRGKTPFALIRQRQIGNPKIKLMLRTLALKKACLQPSIKLKDESIIAEDPKQWTYYQNCLEQIRKMKSTRFIESCTLFELLRKCKCQAAALMRHREFESKFRLCDLNGFLYAEEMRRAFGRAQAFYESMLEQEAVINEAFKDILPWTVTRKVARYMLDCKKYKMKKNYACISVQQ